LSDAASCDRTTNTLGFSPTFAQVLNLGSTDDAIIAESRTTSEREVQRNSVIVQAEQRAGGDAEFLSALPSSLGSLIQSAQEEQIGDLLNYL